MKQNEIVAALAPVIKAFDEAGIQYYIGGSIASSAFGIARATLDVDIVSKLGYEHIKPLINILKNEYYIDEEMIKDAIKKEFSFNLVHLGTMLKIDVFILKKRNYEQKAFERKILEKFSDDPEALEVYLCSPEDIILTKLDWYKSSGEVIEQQWRDILGVIKIQTYKLDKSYLKTWAKELDVYDLLKRGFEECNIDLV
jgi:hypothetical protein